MKKQTIIYLATAVSLLVASFVFGFIFSGNDPIMNKPILSSETKSLSEGYPSANSSESSAASLALDKAVVNEDKALSPEKITPSTKMVYEYYYVGDGKIETTEEIPPYFLLDMTEEDMKDTFIDWDILAFDSKEVVMRKNIQGKSDQYYIVGVHEGYIAVFYETETNGSTLKELTDMPVSAFAKEEQDRLRAGIHVSGNNELIKILEDYGS